MAEILKLARLFFVLLGIFAVGRWILGVRRVPYEQGHHIFSIVTTGQEAPRSRPTSERRHSLLWGKGGPSFAPLTGAGRGLTVATRRAT